MTAPTSRRPSLPLLAGLALVLALVGAALLLTPAPPAGPRPTAGAASPAAPGPLHQLAITLVDGRAAGDDTLQARQGEHVEVAIASDRPLVLHLHGYEVETHAGPAQAGTLVFDARLPGRFPVHEHRVGAGNHRAVFFIEIQP